MFYDNLELPEEYRSYRSTRVRGATGPSFMVPFEFSFTEPKTIEEVFIFLEDRHFASKGVSIYLNELNLWIVFCFKKFHSVSSIAPVAEIKIGRAW
jgi:hypothetical protein